MNSLDTRNDARFYLAVALICGCVMALQILQARIFSVMTWYHLSFLTISIAMFGLTLGALQVYRGNADEQREKLYEILQRTALAFGLWTVCALAVQMVIPIVSTAFKTIIVTLPFVAAVTAMAYYHAGKIVSLCLTRSGRPTGRVYAADMIGASAGCLCALLLMQLADAPSSVLIIAGASILSAFMARSVGKPALSARFALLGFAFIATGVVNASLPRAFVYPIWTKGNYLPHQHMNFEKWNAISRIVIIPDFPELPINLWGPSPKMPHFPPQPYQLLSVDGAAVTPITKFDGKNWKSLKYLEYDLTNLAHFMPGIKSVAIIGVGGGRDLLSALYFGAKHVVALDINNIQISLLTKNPQYTSYSNLNHQPGVNIVHSEARSWLTRTPETFDFIQMSMIDTWSSTGAGAFALTENSLYTVEAWKVYLRHLNKNGTLMVNRWHSPGPYADIGRMASMTTEALLELGEKEPWKNVFIAHTGRLGSIIIGRHPLTDAQLDALHSTAQKMGYEILASPRLHEDNIVNRILHASNLNDVLNIVKGEDFDLTPATDLRPFFFNQAHMNRPLLVIRQARELPMLQQNLRGHAIATLNLYIILIFSLISSVLVLVLPFRKALVKAPAEFIRAGSAYFIMIGLGFMFVEITLMQIMGMFLGHPVYGLGIVLFSLILSTGIGSFVSEHFPLDNKERVIVWSFLTGLYVAFLSFSIMKLLNVFIQSEFPVRVLLCLVLILPCGVLMGFAFPTGMRLTDRVSTALTPWFWGINGAGGVVASAMAMVISIGWGLNYTMMAGALCYAMLAVPALRLLRQGPAISR
jgi:predicted membrane-bound spermidine synthase